MNPIKINRWIIVFPEHISPYTAPELITQHLNGDVVGHPKFEDGKNITTSPIVGSEGIYVKTQSGSLYELIDPHPDYEKQFPDAKNRLFNSFTNGG